MEWICKYKLRVMFLVIGGKKVRKAERTKKGKSWTTVGVKYEYVLKYYFSDLDLIVASL